MTRRIGAFTASAAAVLAAAAPAFAQDSGGLGPSGYIGFDGSTGPGPSFTLTPTSLNPGALTASSTPPFSTGFGPGSAGYARNRVPGRLTRGPLPDPTAAPPPLDPAAPVQTTSLASGPALVDVRVPANAEVWFDGVRMNLNGPRPLRSPALDSGVRYSYDVHSRWMQDGQLVEQTRRIQVRAGDHAVVDFTRPQ
jgi:uncharacterized protein (TIGR03000 family)